MISDELRRDMEVMFVCRSGSELAAQVLQAAHRPAVLQADGQDLARLVLAMKPTVVLNDFLDTPGEYVKALKDAGVLVVSFEDEGKGTEYCDLVVNELYLHATSHDQFRYGPDYFCLREEFLATPPSAFRESVSRIVVTFGGVDAVDSTGRMVRILAANPELCDHQVTVITGPGYQHRHRLLDTLGGVRGGPEFAWIEKTHRMAEHMAAADYAFTSAGRTVFELAAMRVPAIVLAANRKEERHKFAALNGGCIYLGRHDVVSDAEVVTALQLLTRDVDLRARMRERLDCIDLRGGRSRVIEEIRQLVTRRGVR